MEYNVLQLQLPEVGIKGKENCLSDLNIKRGGCFYFIARLAERVSTIGFFERNEGLFNFKQCPITPYEIYRN